MINKGKINSQQCSKCPQRHLSAFKSLQESICDSIDTIRELQAVAADQMISFNHNDLRGFYCIQSGHLKLGRENVQKSGVVRICGPGDLVGYETSTSLPSAQMIEDGKICFIKMEEFLKIQNAEPEVAASIVQALVKIIKIKDERIVGLENHSVKNRVASTLLSLVKKFGLQTKNGLLIDAKIDRKTLAQLAGTVTESLARALTELEDDKIISRQGRSIFVLCKEKLQAVILK